MRETNIRVGAATLPPTSQPHHAQLLLMIIKITPLQTRHQLNIILTLYTNRYAFDYGHLIMVNHDTTTCP